MKKIIAASLALGVGVSGASAQNLSLQGSDTLFDITQSMLQLCQISPSNAIYVGGGTGAGENAMVAGTQQIAPMSRFLNTAACGRPAPQNKGMGIAHSLDAIGILADDTEPTTCNTMRFSGFMEVQPTANGNTTLECPNCVDGPDADGVLDHFQFSDWSQAIRIIYAGKHSAVNANACAALPPSAPSATTEPKACDSDVRFTLVNTWGNMFEGGCTDGECTQLKHAFRRDDVSGTTDTFLSLLSLPGTSNNPAPFCNGTEFEDVDPIRRACDGNGQSTGGENVCRRTTLAKETGTASPTTAAWGAITAANAPSPSGQGDLGLVLPMIIPQVIADAYPNNNVCAVNGFGGRFKFGPMPASLLPAAQQLCPNGTPRAFAGCLWPVDASGNYGCVNSAGNRPVGVTGFANNMDGRVYNLTPRRLDGSIPTAPRRSGSSIVQRPLLNVGFYRIHQRTLQANASGSTCRLPDATEQIGCLVHASPCSLGFAGLTADLQDPNKVLELRSPLASGAGAGGAAAGGVAPSASNIRRLLEDCTAGNYAVRYPLSRKLYLNTLIGFNSVVNNPGTTPVVTQEAQFVSCWMDRRFLDRAAIQAGFIPLSENDCSTLPLPDPSTSFSTPTQCDLRDNVPSTEVQLCAGVTYP